MSTFVHLCASMRCLKSSGALVEKSAKVPHAVAFELVALNRDEHLLLQEAHVRVRRARLFVFAQLTTKLPFPRGGGDGGGDGGGGGGGGGLLGCLTQVVLHAQRVVDGGRCRGLQGGW